MKTLIVIFGQIRTFEHCLRSMLDNIIIPNKPCDVVLAIDGSYHEIPKPILQDLKYYLIDIYTTQNKTVERDHQSIEFSLVKHAMDRIPDMDSYKFMLKIRTDLFVRSPINIKTIYGTCSNAEFERYFFKNWKNDPGEAVQSWLLTGGLDFFKDKQLNRACPPRSPWSIQNIFEWNHSLFEKIRLVFQRLDDISIHTLKTFIQKFCENEKIVYLIGSTWIHFGLAKDIKEITEILYHNHTKMTWPGKNDEDELEWVDHKGETRRKLQKDWKLITDDQFRLVHHLHGYHLMDLVNNNDYIESFDAHHTHNVNKKNRNLFAWIVREKSLK
jgi:hypothetical protein